MTSQKRYVSIQEAVSRLGKSDKTLRRWIASGKLPSKRAKDGRILVQVDMVPGDAPTLEERVTQLEEQVRDLRAQVAELKDALVMRLRQPKAIRKMAGGMPR